MLAKMLLNLKRKQIVHLKLCLIDFQNDGSDVIAREAYRSLFFLSYYNRDTTEAYKEFIDNVKNVSLSKFGYLYGPQEEVTLSVKPSISSGS